MSTSRTDVLVGLFILVSIGVIVGALIITSGIREGRYDLYMRAETAQGLSQDTRVLLQGLDIGRVRAVSPVLDTATRDLSFLATLAIQERFPNGAELRLPVGTRGVITQPATLVGAQQVTLQLPPAGTTAGFLQPGDTIPSSRPTSMMDALTEIATTLNEQLGVTLEETQRLLSRTGRTVDAASGMIQTTQPRFLAVLDSLATTLDRAGEVLTALEPRVVSISDSLLATLSETRAVLQEFDSLATTARGMTIENREAITSTIEHLERSAIILAHFADQVSRRPVRLLTGVTPPDTAAADTTEGRQ